MKVLAVDAEGRLVTEDRDPPSPGEGDVLVAVEACGLCGSDLSMLAAGGLLAGRVLGHEISGSLAASSAAERRGGGARLAILPAPRCGLVESPSPCRQCRDGKSHLCAMQGARTLGLTVDGGFAEFVAVSRGQCFELGQDTPADVGALVEPLAVALHAIGVGEAWGGPGECVVVLGAGPIGLLITLTLAERGVEVAVVERSSYRRALADDMGAAAVSADWKDRETRRGYSTVFECTGNTEALEAALGLATPGGSVILVGAPKPDRAYRIHGLAMLVREVKLLPSMAYTTEEFGMAVAETSRSPAKFRKLITHSIALDDAARELPRLIESGEFGKVVVTP